MSSEKKLSQVELCKQADPVNWLDLLRSNFRRDLLQLFEKYGATLEYECSYDSCSGTLMDDGLEITTKDGGQYIYLLLTHGCKLSVKELGGD